MNRCFKCKETASGFIENIPTCDGHWDDAVFYAYGEKDAMRRGYSRKAKAQKQTKLDE